MGGKHLNLDPKFQPKKCAVRYKGNDRLSRMPDEVLILILSRLPLKEAGRTSVLSSRWINLWKYTSGLNFDAEIELDNIAKKWKQKKSLHARRCKYINWVNSVIRSHKGLTLEEFRICFDFDKFSHKALTHWLEFAFAKKVERLALELCDDSGSGIELYNFPVNLLSRMTNGTCTVQRKPRAPLDAKALKVLCLKSVDVTDEAIEFFIHNCSLLEQLIVHDSSKLSNLKVCGSSLRLKHLEIMKCYNICSLKVSAPNLTSLILAYMYGLLLENVPMLVNLYIDCLTDISYENEFVPTLLGLPQLKMLTMMLPSLMDDNKAWKFPELPQLTKLKIMYLDMGYECLMGVTSFIEACPYLQEFVFKVEWDDEILVPDNEINSFTVSTQFRHQHLKVIKFSGYYGGASNIELIRYMLESYVVLEKIIIDPRFQAIILPDEPTKPCLLEAERIAKIRAKQQFEELPPSQVELVIL